MSATIGQLFDKAATSYDAERRVLLPSFDAFYGAALDAIGPLPAGAAVLDIGAGTGLFAALLAARAPGLRLTLFDLAPEMLSRAEARFAILPGPPPELVIGNTAEGLPEGPFDAIISALSIHHLTDAQKKATFARVATRLKPGGVFVNAEQIAAETAAEETRRDRAWEAGARALGATDEMISAARTRMAHDKCAPIAAQLGWMSEAGLREAACPWQEGRFAVLTARACAPRRSA